MASAGPISLFAAAAWTASRGASYAKTLSAAAIFLVVLWTLSFSQTFIYKDSDTLWKDTAARNPDAWIAHANLAVASINSDPDAAIAHGEKAYRMNPSNELISNALGLAFYRKSKALAQKGMDAESHKHNERAIGFTTVYQRSPKTRLT
jgi:hypothetical protein